ncbi:MAG: transcription-repair coupling factor [Treponema sp.]|jgi:transcription-repair coupling factor (superfamily II helicase)|nr:transcription-repair coupling factor [Treponema sp.]
MNILCHTVASSPSVRSVLDSFSRHTPLELEVREKSLISLLIALFYQRSPQPTVVVVPTDREANIISTNLLSIGIPVKLLPWWGALSYYQTISLRSPVFSERTAAFTHILSGGIAVVPQRACVTYMPPPDYFKKLLLTLTVGSTYDTTALLRQLSDAGYVRVPKVQLGGELSVHGEVLDICIKTEEAYRILFDYCTVESIKQFDPANQYGTVNVNTLTVPPLREVLWSDERIETLSHSLESCEEFPDHGAAVIDALINHREFPGHELFFSLAFEKPATLLDYTDSVILVERERLETASTTFSQEMENLYKKSVNSFPKPQRIVGDFSPFLQYSQSISFVALKDSLKQSSQPILLDTTAPCSLVGTIEAIRERLKALADNGWTIIITVESDIQQTRIQYLLRNIPCSVVVLALDSGFALPDIRVFVVHEQELLGRRTASPRSLKTVRSVPIDTFVELNSGDFVVHVNHGIGIFRGIDRVKALEHERDYIKIEYASEEIVFVPVEQVDLVQRYISHEGNNPRLDTLGSKAWEHRKKHVQRSVEALAEHLIDVYSKRKALQGFAFPPDSEWQTLFEANFPFEETPDQTRCIAEIKADMESPLPMDRLVCGDVGYGKTEVALRAAFKAIMSGKQVAFLAPTTILVEQHFENFQERFIHFPVHIAMLSRFVDKKTIKTILSALEQGSVDFVVGTHRLLQADVHFKNLGLMVIDEEQRFGVKDKERLKELKYTVDCLTLSATPIPRTLHMNLLKVRDMSLLTTPPRNRHPIETFVGEYDSEKIVQAIRREVARNGQVFFLHNRIETLEDTRLQLERLIPEILVNTAHGRMNSDELESVIHHFMHGGFHVLVSTTIIENGIDMPNVNTIIIDRADLYGVSQLYQLRGRVGRSDRVAYAYLFYPGNTVLSELAMRRLEAISDFTELGSGFKIAMKDLEIRGAGNLLGKEQSGDIYSVGFDLYVRLLNEAIQRLNHAQYAVEPLIELEYSGFIPDTYIDSLQEKMEIYKKIAAVRETEAIEQLTQELLDRFGPIPQETQSLLSLASLRIICRELAIASVKEKAGTAVIKFSHVEKINITGLVRIMKNMKDITQLPIISVDPQAADILRLKTASFKADEKISSICTVLRALCL